MLFIPFNVQEYGSVQTIRVLVFFNLVYLVLKAYKKFLRIIASGCWNVVLIECKVQDTISKCQFFFPNFNRFNNNLSFSIKWLYTFMILLVFTNPCPHVLRFNYLSVLYYTLTTPRCCSTVLNKCFKWGKGRGRTSKSRKDMQAKCNNDTKLRNYFFVNRFSKKIIKNIWVLSHLTVW